MATRQHNHQYPLSLDGRGIKGEGENDASASSRHCGLDPQSRGAGRAGQQQDNATNPGPSFPRRRESTGRGGNKTTQPPKSPSPLMGEELKARVKTMHQHRHVIADLIRNPEGQGVLGNNKTTQPTPDRHSRVGGNPQRGATTRQHQPYIPLSLDGR